MEIEIAGGRLTARSAGEGGGRDAAVFSLSGGGLGIRGELEETSFRTGTAILSGFFDREEITYGERFYGYPQCNEFSVYAPNALGFRILWEGVEAGPAGAADFEKTLDTVEGTFSHSYTAQGPGGARLRVAFKRCVPLDCAGLLIIRCRAEPCGGCGRLTVRAYLTAGDGEPAPPPTPERGAPPKAWRPCSTRRGRRCTASKRWRAPETRRQR